MTHKVLYLGGDQALTYTPPTRVASCSFIIEDYVYGGSTNVDRIVASGSATLDVLNTTIDTTSGLGQSDPRKLYVASTAYVTSSHRYVIAHADDGSSETFTAEGGYTDSYILASAPLLRQYPTGSTVRGITFSATFPSSWADDLTKVQRDEPLRIVWEYDIDGRTTSQQEEIELVRHDQGDMSIDKTLAMIQEEWPDFSVKFTDQFQLRNSVKGAVKYIRAKLLGKSIAPEQFLMGEQGQQLLYWRTLYNLSLFGVSPQNVDAQTFQATCLSHFDDFWGDISTARPGLEVSLTSKVDDTAVTKKNMPYKSIIGRC